MLIEAGSVVRVLIRDPRKFEAFHPNIKIVKGDLTDSVALQALTEEASAFLHLAGVTHARDWKTYEAVNLAGAVNAADAAKRHGVRFVFASSLSAREPDVSPYARSKRDAEEALAGEAVSMRLPAIYGPGDVHALPLFKLAKAGFAVEPMTEPPARFSLLYVDDAAKALIKAADASCDKAVYEVNDDQVDGRSWADVGEVLAGVLGRKTRRLRAPRFVIAAQHSLALAGAALTRRAPSVRPGQIDEFFHPDWVARNNLFGPATGWRPETDIEEGFAKTVRWYQKGGLL